MALTFSSLRALRTVHSRPKYLEGKPTLTPTDTHEETSATAEQTAAEETHTHEGHDHDHEGHDHAGHTHSHAPTLNPELMRTIEVEAPAEDVDKAFRKVTKRYAKMARIPGFRAGKVPESLIKSRFAKDVRQEVLESLVSDKFRQALEAQTLQPVSQPQVSELQLFESQPLKFKATFEVLPEINIDGYDQVSVEKPDTALSEDEYQAELNKVLDHHATVEPVEDDRPLVDGDWAEIGFKGQVQDLAQTVTEEGLEGTSEGNTVTGEDVLIQIAGPNTLPAFTESLRGAKVGQELEFEASYPAEFGDARLAGKTVKYDVTVKAIKKKTFPERDEQFAKQLGNYENWGEFETKLRERIEHRKQDALESQARDKMLDEIVAKYQFPVPETFVQAQIDARLERGLRALAQQGMSAEAMRQLDFGRLREAQRDQAVSEVKASLLLDRIAEREGVAVTDEDLERELLMLSIQAREPMDALRKRMSEDGSLNRMREQMRREKTGSVLYGKLAQ
jgi:trigger factor